MNVMGKLIFLVILYVLFALEEYFYVIFAVSLCVREWIETVLEQPAAYNLDVSLCVREWIETPPDCGRLMAGVRSPSA